MSLVLGDNGIRTWAVTILDKSNPRLYNRYLLLPSQELSIIRIRQVLTGSLSGWESRSWYWWPGLRAKTGLALNKLELNPMLIMAVSVWYQGKYPFFVHLHFDGEDKDKI